MKLFLFFALAFSARIYGYVSVTLDEARSLGVAIAGAGAHACALSEDGIVSCWGENQSGQATPPPMSKVIQLALGDFHSCAVTEEGKVFCWGWNWMEQNNVPRLPKIKQVATGNSHTCALSEEGNLTCWGWNVHGQAPPRGWSGIQQVAAGSAHSCALKAKGEVFCFGLEDANRTAVPALPRIKQIVAGYAHTCALSESGKVYCWGDKRENQIFVPELSNIRKLVAGNSHTCALSEDDSVSCWGSNSSGQLDGFSNVKAKQLALGTSYTCLVKEDGTTPCWGKQGQSTFIPKAVTEMVAGDAPIYFRLASLERNLRRLSKRLYQYKSSYLTGMSDLLAELKTETAQSARFFVLELVSPVIESTQTQFVKERALENLAQGLREAKEKLGVPGIASVDLTANVFRVCLTAARLAMQSSKPFLLGEVNSSNAEKFLTQIALLDVKVKTEGFRSSQAQEFKELLMANKTLIEQLQSEARTSGFGTSLEKIRIYFESK